MVRLCFHHNNIVKPIKFRETHNLCKLLALKPNKIHLSVLIIIRWVYKKKKLLKENSLPSYHS